MEAKNKDCHVWFSTLKLELFGDILAVECLQLQDKGFLNTGFEQIKTMLASVYLCWDNISFLHLSV